MASTQKQKTAFGGSVAGSLSERLPGSAPGVGSLKTMKCSHPVKRPGSTWP